MPDLSLDHVIIGVEDLWTAAAELRGLLGRRPSWRGRHPGYGTANVLFRLENSYIELLAPDPEATSDTAWTGSLGRFLREHRPGLFSIALQTPDVFAAATSARARGLPVEEPLPGTGLDLDSNAEREWVNARIPPEATRGTRCFFITHKSTVDVLPRAALIVDAAAAVMDTVAVVATSSEMEGARRMWGDVFGLPESQGAPGDWRYELGNANLLLHPGKGTPSIPDAWEALVVSVPDLHRAEARLSAEGIALERSSICGYEGISVTICGARILVTEAK